MTKIRLPESEDVQFVRTRSTGTVHVLVPEFDDPQAIREPTGADVARFFLGASAAMCGRTIYRNRGGVEESGSYVSHFDDDDLCRACYKATHPDDAHRLFEHEPSND